MPILKVSHQGETFPFHAVAAGPEAGYIAPTTARDHVQDILRRLGVRSRAAAAVEGQLLHRRRWPWRQGACNASRRGARLFVCVAIYFDNLYT